VFTRAYGDKSPQDAAAWVGEFRQLLQAKLGAGFTVPGTVPCFQVDSHPEQQLDVGVPADEVEANRCATSAQLAAVLQLASSKVPGLSTEHAVFGEYEVHKARRDADAARVAAEERARADAAAALAAHVAAERLRLEREAQAARIVETHTETREEVVGHERRETYRKTRRQWLGTRDSVYTHMFQQYRIDHRTKSVRGDGQVVYGNWQLGAGGTHWRDIGQEEMYHC
jgi:hypothetical protein